MSFSRRTVALISIGLVTFFGSISVGQTQPRVRPTVGGQRAQSPAQAGGAPRGTIQDANRSVQKTGQGQASQPQNEVQVGPPEGYRLTPAESKRLDQMLVFWEQKTSGVTTMRAEFGRWVYDPVFGPKTDAKTFTTGEIRYSAPDKGMIQEKALGKKGSGIYEYSAEMKKKGEKWPYLEKQQAFGEHWVCDGKSVFEFNHKAKQLVETKLPAEMQGKAIADGPLPFMFGAKKDTIKRRYWIREIPQQVKAAPYQLELVPKGRGEEFSRIRIKLDPKTFLPTEMVLYDLNSVGRSAYAFKNLKANSAQDNLKNFLGSFVSPKTPQGWEKIIHDLSNPTPGPGPRQAQAARKQLKR